MCCKLDRVVVPCIDLPAPVLPGSFSLSFSLSRRSRVVFLRLTILIVSLTDVTVSILQQTCCLNPGMSASPTSVLRRWLQSSSGFRCFPEKILVFNIFFLITVCACLSYKDRCDSLLLTYFDMRFSGCKRRNLPRALQLLGLRKAADVSWWGWGRVPGCPAGSVLGWQAVMYLPTLLPAAACTSPLPSGLGDELVAEPARCSALMSCFVAARSCRQLEADIGIQLR